MKTASKYRPRRIGFDPALSPLNTTAIATSSVVSTKWQIDFTNPVQVAALPADFLVAGVAPISYVQNTPTRITLSYATPVATGQTWAIPSRSLNVRTPTGGFVASAAGTF